MRGLKSSFIILVVLTTTNIFAENKNEVFKDNSVKVNSISQTFVNSVKEINLKTEKTIQQLMNEYCTEEVRIFCQNKQESYNCLKMNYSLITGQCKTLLSKEFGTGISYGRLNIHDLKLTKDTEFFGTKKKEDHVVSKYKSNNNFEYKGITFRKGYLEARSYPELNYKGQYVLVSAKPAEIFKDSEGILFNPFFQKGPFFFDEKGRVKIGTLGKNYEYKNHVVLKKGTIIAFDNERNLIRGIINRTTRVGNCQLLKNTEISDNLLTSCLKK